jgi:hypothetical protein
VLGSDGVEVDESKESGGMDGADTGTDEDVEEEAWGCR